jgi:hypothetical protein
MISGTGTVICTEVLVRRGATLQDNTSISVEPVYKMSRSGVKVLIITSSYLESCI